MHEVSDMATRIRNALQVNHSEVNIRATKLGKNIATVLRNEGFITDFKENPNGTHFTITLKYIGKKKQPSLSHFQPISKPSLRVYRSAMEISDILGGIGIAILSTPNGILTHKEAKKQRVGGEVLCYLW